VPTAQQTPALAATTAPHPLAWLVHVFSWLLAALVPAAIARLQEPSTRRTLVVWGTSLGIEAVSAMGIGIPPFFANLVAGLLIGGHSVAQGVLPDNLLHGPHSWVALLVNRGVDFAIGKMTAWPVSNK
jgi:hypothetical protein